MVSLSDREAGDSITFKFTTKGLGVPKSLDASPTPVISVYKAGSTGESIVGVTLTPDYDSVGGSRAGMNDVTITTASDGAFYSNGSDFDVVLTVGSIEGASIAGEVWAHFRLRAA